MFSFIKNIIERWNLFWFGTEEQQAELNEMEREYIKRNRNF